MGFVKAQLLLFYGKEINITLNNELTLLGLYLMVGRLFIAKMPNL